MTNDLAPSKQKSNRKPRHWFWLSVALLLLGWAVRAHAIEALPPFNDESHHIRRAELVYGFSDPDLSMTPGKLLSYYWLGLFGAERLDAIFIGRTATALFAVLGLAGTFATTRLLFGQRAGILALFFASFVPFMVFFDRLALTDPLTASLSMWLVWASLVMVKKQPCQRKSKWAVIVGILSGLVVMAKLLGLPMLGIPFLAVLIYGKQVPWPGYHPRQIWQWLVAKWQAHQPMLRTVYGVVGLIFAPSSLYILGRIIFDGELVPIVNNNLINGAAENKPPPQVILDNLGTLGETHWVLHSPILALMILGAIGWALYKRKKHGLYLLGAVALAWSLSIFVAAELSTRYLTLGVLPLLALVAGTLDEVLRRLPRLGRGAVSGVLMLWLIIFALPFIRTAWSQPAALDLPERDRWEYYANFSSGYALVSAAHDIETLPPSQPSGRVNLIGLVGSCHQMRLYLDEYGPVWLECPFFGWQGENMDEVATNIQTQVATESTVYLLVEPDLTFTDLSVIAVDWELIRRYGRPFEGMVVELYRVYPLGEMPSVLTEE